MCSTVAAASYILLNVTEDSITENTRKFLEIYVKDIGGPCLLYLVSTRLGDYNLARTIITSNFLMLASVLNAFNQETLMLNELVEMINCQHKENGNKVLEIKNLAFSVPTNSSAKRSNQGLDLLLEQVFKQIKTTLPGNNCSEAINLLSSFRKIQANNTDSNHTEENKSGLQGKHYNNSAFVQAIIALILVKDRQGSIPEVAKELTCYKEYALENITMKLSNKKIGDYGLPAHKNLSRPVKLIASEENDDWEKMGAGKLQRECVLKLNDLDCIEREMMSHILEKIIAGTDKVKQKASFLSFLRSF